MRARAARVLETVGCDAFVASDPFTVAWLTGFAADETWGPNPFAARAARGRAASDGSVVAIVSEDEAPALEGSGCEVVAYEGFTIGPARHRSPRAGAALASLGLRGRVAVEDGALPVPGVEPVQADAHALRLLRAVKDDDEIARIRAAIAHLRRRARRRRAARCAAVSASSRRGAQCRARWRWRRASASRCCAISRRGERTGGDRRAAGPARRARRRPRDRRPRPASGRLLRRLVRDGGGGRRAGGGALGARALQRGARAGPRGARARAASRAISTRSCAAASTTRITPVTASASRRTRSRASCRAARRCSRPG